MKNCIFIINDSMRYETVGDGEWGLSATPFIDSIKKDCLIANNMYSEAPYTEAAIKCLLTGKDTLDDNGYFYRFNAIKTDCFSQFKNKDYETLYTTFPDFWFSKETENNVDYMIYTELPSYLDFYLYRVKFYIEQNNSSTFSEYQIQQEIKLYEIYFNAYISFFEKYEKDSSNICYKLIRNQMEKINWKEILHVWRNEYSSFMEDKAKYVLNVVCEKENHILYKTSGSIWNLETDGKLLKTMYKKNKNFFDDCYKLQRKMNKKNGYAKKELYKSFFVRFIQKLKKINLSNYNTTTYFSNWHARVINNDFEMLMDKYDIKKYEVWASFRRQVDLLLEYIDSKDNDKPFFIVMHNLNPHYLCSPLTYDTDDENLMQNEIDVLKSDIKKVSNKFSGFLSYRFATRYIDMTTEYLFKELEKRGILENTTIGMTADHGSSFGHGPVRKEPFVNNNYSENYHIPFIVYNGGVFGEIDTLATSKDIFPTMDDLMGIGIDGNFTGHSILHDYKQEIIHSEYMGPGCPDLKVKDIRFVARNKKYKVSYYVNILKDFEDGTLLEIYDRTKDPHEFHNLVSKVNVEEVKDLLEYLRNRYSILQKEYKFE